MHRRFRQLFSSLKEQSTVSYAKAATMGGFCHVDHIVVKATTPDDLPLPERYVAELLQIFSISPSSFRAFSVSFSRRFSKTHCWRVALKSLLLLHRLLRSVPDNTPFRSELIWSRSSASFSLHPCHFRDHSDSSEQYTHFIKSYARLLDEALDSDFKQEDMSNEVAQMVEVLPQLQSLMDRAMACRPAGIAARNPTVQSAMRQIMRESFTCYGTFRREMVVVLEKMFEMAYRDCMAAFAIYKKAASQASELSEFHEWGKSMGVCGMYEYPFIDRIPHIQIQALDAFLNGMWQLTESCSASSEDGEGQLVVWSDKGMAESEKALIEWEESDKESWEDLLEAAVNLYSIQNNSLVLHINGGDGCGDDWKQIQLYNPFNYSGNPLYPWGL